MLSTSIATDIKRINAIPAVESLLDLACKSTGMGFSAIARVTDTQWVACKVCDHISFGMQIGDELDIETTLCQVVKRNQKLVVIKDVSTDAVYSTHFIPKMYNFESYISVPIFLKDGTFFGTMCGIDKKPFEKETQYVIDLFSHFAELISFHMTTVGELKSAKELLAIEKEIGVNRDQFISILGHDLRTPLNSISLGAELLKRHNLTPENTDIIISSIESSAERMTEMVGDILDLARSNLDGGIPIQKNEHSDKAFIESVEHLLSEIKSFSLNKNISIDFNITDKIQCDLPRITQIVENLVTNAINHGYSNTPIKANIYCEDAQLIISVTNQSDPIPENKINQLFHVYKNPKDLDKPRSNGLGLGLHIISEIAKSHGGKIECRSNPEKTTFTVAIPQNTQA